MGKPSWDGEALHEQRIKANVSVIELADHVGETADEIRGYEDGEEPTFVVGAVIADRLGCCACQFTDFRRSRI